MIFKDKTNPYIEKLKTFYGLSGDVYKINNQIESLESHKKLFPQSKATNIEQAEREFIVFKKKEQQELIKKQQILNEVNANE